MEPSNVDESVAYVLKYELDAEGDTDPGKETIEPD